MLTIFKNRHIRSAFRSFLFFLLFCISSSLSGLYMKISVFNRNVGGFWNERLYCRVNFFYSLLMFFSIASVFCLNNTALKNSFLQSTHPQGKLRFILKNPCYLTELAIITVCCIFAPEVSLFGDFTYGYFAKYPFIARKSICLVIVLPALLLIHIFTYLSTVSWWSRQKRTKKKQEDTTTLKFVRQLAITVAIWLIGGNCMSIVYPMMVSFYTILKVFKIPLLIFSAVLFIALFTVLWIRYLRTVCMRKAIIDKMRKICKIRGWSFSLRAHPYRSVFVPDEGYHISVTGDGIDLTCRFISSPFKKTPLYLLENGYTVYSKDRVLFKHYISEKYFFDADEASKKIIIVCPCNGRIFIKGDDTEKLVDVGDKMMDYRLYNSSGFINGFERGVFCDK